MNPSIAELKHLSNEDQVARIRERVVDMYVKIGDPASALTWLWTDISSLQTQEVI